MLVNSQRGDGLRKDMVGVKIRVMADIPVARPPTGIDRKLRQVGKPVPYQVRVDPGCSATHQRAKWVEICGSRSLGDQIRVEERVVSDLIIGVVVDIVLHFILNYFQGLRIIWIATAAWNFVVLDATEFVVLDPKIGLENLKCRREPEQGSVSRCETTRTRTRGWQRPRRSLCGCGDCGKQSRANCSSSEPERFS